MKINIEGFPLYLALLKSRKQLVRCISDERGLIHLLQAVPWNGSYFIELFIEGKTDTERIYRTCSIVTRTVDS